MRVAGYCAQGTEWVILTPHYTRPGPVAPFMDLQSESGPDVMDDPRPYVKALRAFAAARGGRGVALADASMAWGRLWRRGIPYTSLLLNSINHPNAEGMMTFADALLPLLCPS
jgi:lysophospholipase L1-like esterase